MTHRSAETVPTVCISRNLEGRVCKSLWTIKLTDTGCTVDLITRPVSEGHNTINTVGTNNLLWVILRRLE